VSHGRVDGGACEEVRARVKSQIPNPKSQVSGEPTPVCRRG
jgi:hypothetical protein